MPNKPGHRICDECRKYHPKSELIANVRGQFCRKCHKVIFSQKKTAYGVILNSCRSEKYD